MSFIGNYSKFLIVFLIVKYFIFGGNVVVECNGIVSWIEVIWNCVRMNRYNWIEYIEIVICIVELI